MTAGLDRLKSTRLVALATREQTDERLTAVALLYLSLLASALGFSPFAIVCVVAAVLLRVDSKRCRHPQTIFKRDIHGDEIVQRGYRSEWVCVECGALVTRQELHGLHRDPVGVVFGEIEELAIGVLAARVRGLEAYLAARGVVVEWKDGTATWDALTRDQEGQQSRRERALAIEVAEERAARWAAEEERDKLKGELGRSREVFDAMRERVALLCGECIETTSLSDVHKHFTCTGRGRMCNLPVGPGHVVELPGKVTPEEHRALDGGDDKRRRAEEFGRALRGD